MLIPKYWAQYKQRFDSKTEFNESPKQATIKRYGWSDTSQEAALVHAKERVANAHSRWLAGEDIVRRERREEYNDSNGIPIREAIISEHGFSENGLIEGNLENRTSDSQLIVTRNSYGARLPTSIILRLSMLIMMIYCIKNFLIAMTNKVSWVYLSLIKANHHR